MKEPLWNFIDDKGTFVSKTAHQINNLYFPLCNKFPFLSSVSPDLHGDIKTNNSSFLLEPVSRIDLTNSRSSRNFWIYINSQKIWSATGVSKDISTIRNDTFKLEAGLLWHRIIRENQEIGLKAEITSFVPAADDPVEIMLISITNISSGPIKFIPTAAIPIYARSADNLRDHRHVSSLLNRIQTEKFGVIITPTLLFDETGHKKNRTSYFVFGIDQNSCCPKYIYPTQEEFTGDNSDLEAPNAILHNLPPDKKRNIQGKEAMAGLRFKKEVLKVKHSRSYIIVMGITEDKTKTKTIFNNFNTLAKVKNSLEVTVDYWQKQSAQLLSNTADNVFDNWLRWVNIQPVLRKFFGCSFLPDFDYGRGRRGWRDLWQDCLSLILTNPKEARTLLINNFSGVRIDGSNATIIGRKPGDFIADRNNISRVWMDHGLWPLITTLLYIHQSGDMKILLENTAYFRDHQLTRSKVIDYNWTPGYGKQLKTKNSKTYQGTVLEHILVENLVQFFNVGPHNHIRLENADWNDGLDMAADYGESVALSSMYAQNLEIVCELLENSGQKNISILKELKILLDSLTSHPIDYSNIKAKHKILDIYFGKVKNEVSGKKISLPTHKLICDLSKKADWLITKIQKTEWLKEGFFNGYYNNDKKRVEGKIKGRIRMTLTGQVFPIMSGIATGEQTKRLLENVQKYLKDRRLPGFRLNTDFKEEQFNLGRAFSFAYGDKENGAFFNHMLVMFAYSLYKRGFIKEGFRILNSIYKMAVDTERSKIYPCLPEYFNSEGRGMYSYLTGSASWFILTLLTQVFGIRGDYGNFIIEPKLTAAQFKEKDNLSISTCFAERKIEVRFINPHKKDFGKYSIFKVAINGKVIAEGIKHRRLSLLRSKFLALTDKRHNVIELTLD